MKKKRGNLGGGGTKMLKITLDCTAGTARSASEKGVAETGANAQVSLCSGESHHGPRNQLTRELKSSLMKEKQHGAPRISQENRRTY